MTTKLIKLTTYVKPWVADVVKAKVDKKDSSESQVVKEYILEGIEKEFENSKEEESQR